MKNFKSGSHINQGSYKSFQPNLINKEWQLDDMEMITLLSKADRMLGQLDMYSKHIPNLNIFIMMHVTKEATASTKIEGTQTNIEEALLPEESVPSDKKQDWLEVRNYIKAMNNAITSLEDLPFSSRLIKNIHSVILDGVRGKHKQPGNFRISQNWIGGSNINDASFIPPISSSIPELMNDLEKFVHNEKIHVPELIKIALIHYQFETIHPFLDGNGRTGRLMITLYLVSKGILKAPVLYLSDYLERNRNAYYQKLMNARLSNDINGWFKFFLKGIIETTEQGVSTFEQVLLLQKKCEENIKSLNSRRSTNALKILTDLFQRPITDAIMVAKTAGISITSAYALIKSLEELGILENITNTKRNRMYIFRDYINIFNQ